MKTPLFYLKKPDCGGDIHRLISLRRKRENAPGVLSQNLCYNYPMPTETPPLTGTFRPVTGSRVGEAYAWGLAGVLVVSALLLWWRLGTVPWMVWLLLAFFALAGVLSTFSHWVDRQTVLTLTEEGLTFRNGLRHVHLTWPAVQAVRIQADRWGKRVQVRGRDGQHFAFRTLTEVEIHEGRPQSLFGFQEGEQLAETIVHFAGLHQQAQTDTETYYARA